MQTGISREMTATQSYAPTKAGTIVGSSGGGVSGVGGTVGESGMSGAGCTGGTGETGVGGGVSVTTSSR
jgi:hypothetical protein